MRIRSSSNIDDWVQWQGIHSDGRMKLRDNNDYNVIQLQTASNIQCFGEDRDQVIMALATGRLWLTKVTLQQRD